ncbi:Cystathionine gamma-synthase [Arcticibacter svalbardensis MN12-7]|uniref:Cystathionine gamma-synthase n=1 Tax=Arcticibacter svalbardensis MN12-7 TaxID=1150600 RepID=R9GXC0_9SPHI|nr:cystathionine gamma-synthase family protein [Arcticibacter svalbardensis]EOR96462.1 Cystathionine gamma-synthase [Arcticibacter svalbardensis MN12-7]
MDFSKLKMGTASVWAGETERSYQGATTTPIVNSVTYAYDDLDEWYDVAAGKSKGYIYSRNTNPTVAVLEEKICVLEGAEATTAFATGMAAISNTLFALLSPGKRVVSINDTYGGTSKLFLEFLPEFKIEVSLCNTTDFEMLEKEIAKGCDVLYLETPTNPTLKVVDIKRLAAAAKKVGAVVVVDNTFATPINQNPLQLGADLVIHSATKFLCGHSDAMGGILCGKKELIEKVFRFREINGASIHPEAAYMILRGMKTLELRVERQNASALKIAKYLLNHDQVTDVFYPGLTTHPGHEIAKTQMSGFGGVLSFTIKGGYDQVKQFLPKLKLVHLAASLGSVSTLAGPPRTTSHVELNDEQRKQLGIPESLIRYSVGIENVEDLIADLDTALTAIKIDNTGNVAEKLS